MDKTTALYKQHLALGARMTAFAGYLLPLNYPDGIIAEHRAVRGTAGVFDVSHMGEISIKGSGAGEFLEKALTNNIRSLQEGRARYTVMCADDGGCIDDLLIYRLGAEEYLLVVNAANKDQDYRYLRGLNDTKIKISDDSGEYCQLALQGPLSARILEKLLPLPGKYFSFIRAEGLIISETGYTGEHGYEIYGPADRIIDLWRQLLTLGAVPCGLGCRDTLRFESGLVLYGHEISADIDPLEGGLAFAVDFSKDFIGKEALQGKTRRRRLIGLEMRERGIARAGCRLFYKQRKIGQVTSGTMSPTFNRALANALISEEYADKEEYAVEIRGVMVKAKRAELPFYRRRT